MIYEEVTFEKNFQVGEFLFEKAIMKGRLAPGETVAQAFNAAKADAIDWFNKSNPHLALGVRATNLTETTMTVPSVIHAEKPIPEDQRIQRLIDDINSCRELIVLNSYKLLVKKEPALQEAYDTMHKKLSK